MIESFKEPLTPAMIKVVVQEAFPGTEVVLQPFAGGTIVKAQVWQFHLDINLTTKPIAYGEKEGNARMSLQWKPPEGKMIPIKAGGTAEIGAIKAFVRQARAYLDGIVAAITIACEDPPPAPEADLI